MWYFGKKYPNWMAMDTVVDEYQWLDNRVHWKRAQVLVIWPTGNWPNSNGDTINLPAQSIAVWDRYTVLHEYAHSVMYAAYGNNWPPGKPQSHKICDETSGGSALTEGWAEFMEGAVDNQPYPANFGVAPCKNQTLETNDWFNQVDSGDFDGDVVEGSVASILWDIFDCPAGDDDHVCNRFDAIWSIIRYDHPNNINDFWNDWFTSEPQHTSFHTTSSFWEVYYMYGVKKDAPTVGSDWFITPTSLQPGQNFTATYPILSPFKV